MAPRFSPAPVKPQFSFAGYTAPGLIRWAPTLAAWGFAATGAVILFASPIPKFQADVLRKIPGPIADYFTDKTPDSDKPF